MGRLADVGQPTHLSKGDEAIDGGLRFTPPTLRLLSFPLSSMGQALRKQESTGRLLRLNRNDIEKRVAMT